MGERPDRSREHLRWPVWAAALVAALLRFPGALWPLRPDEAGFLLVARGWSPDPDSMFGDYWVDRPPGIIWLIRLSDAVGGDFMLRAVAAVGCALLVLLAAAAAAEVVAYAEVRRPRPPDRPDPTRRVSIGTAWVTAAFVGSSMIDAVSAKGEILAIPMVLGSCWLALRALRRRSHAAAFGAGLVAMLAPQMKQNMAGGLVFGGVLLVGALVARRLDLARFATLAGVAILGALVPVAATVAWALAEGVRLSTVWYAIYGFRSDAIAVIAEQPSDAPAERAVVLVAVFVATGMALVALWFVATLPVLVRTIGVPAMATAALLAFDVVGVALGGSYWIQYLFALVPGLALAAAHVFDLRAPATGVRRPGLRGLLWGPDLWGDLWRVMVTLCVASTLVSVVTWTSAYAEGRTPREYRTGQAIGAAANPGDTMVVFGGRADVQWASGLSSPYPYLWSLPMRVLDPDLARLAELLRGYRAPTWFVEWVDLDAWSPEHAALIRPILASRYQLVGVTCDGASVYRIADTTLNPRIIGPDISCSGDYRQLVAEP